MANQPLNMQQLNQLGMEVGHPLEIPFWNAVAQFENNPMHQTALNIILHLRALRENQNYTKDEMVDLFLTMKRWLIHFGGFEEPLQEDVSSSEDFEDDADVVYRNLIMAIESWIRKLPEDDQDPDLDFSEEDTDSGAGPLLTKVDQNGRVEDPSTVLRFGKGSAAEDIDKVQKGVKGTTKVIGAVTSKILPGSDIVLDALGDMLVGNVSKIIEQKDIAKRTKKMIQHYNKVRFNNELHPVTRAGLLNIIRQMYNKNLTEEQKQDFKEEYAQILSEDKDLIGPRKPTGVPKKKPAPSGQRVLVETKTGKVVRRGRGQNSESMYCLRCKAMTGSGNLRKVITKNNRHMLQASCADCGANKNKFTAANKS